MLLNGAKLLIYYCFILLLNFGTFITRYKNKKTCLILPFEDSWQLQTTVNKVPWACGFWHTRSGHYHPRPGHCYPLCSLLHWMEYNCLLMSTSLMRCIAFSVSHCHFPFPLQRESVGVLYFTGGGSVRHLSCATRAKVGCLQGEGPRGSEEPVPWQIYSPPTRMRGMKQRAK